MHVMGLLPKFQKKGTWNKPPIKSVSPSKKSAKKKSIQNKSNKERVINKNTKTLKSSHKDVLSTKHHLDCNSYSKYLAIKKLRYQMWMSSKDRPDAIKELIKCNLKTNSRIKQKPSSYSMNVIYIFCFDLVRFYLFCSAKIILCKHGSHNTKRGSRRVVHIAIPLR